MTDPIYLDYNATTPVAPEVLDAMFPALRDLWGNPSSAHSYGRRAAAAVQHARSQVARLLACDATEVVFTSGGTESDNAAIVGVAEALAPRGRHLITSAIEHPAVEQVCLYLEKRGWEVTRLPVDADGRVNPADAERAMRPATALVSVMHANNETGVVQPVDEIGRLARSRGIPFHSDAAQSVGKLPVRVDELGVDLLSVAGHKLYAPKGVGALYIRKGTPFAGFMRGAAHEAGRRAGTENTAQIVGLGAASELAHEELAARAEHMRAMRDRLEAALRAEIPGLRVHGAAVDRLPNTLFAAIPGTDAQRLLGRMSDVAAAAGSACHSDRTEPSPVLRAMGVDDAVALSTLRFSVGRNTSPEEIDVAAETIVAAALADRR